MDDHAEHVYGEVGIDRRRKRPIRQMIDEAKAAVAAAADREAERQALCDQAGLAPWSDEALARFPIGQPERWQR